MSNENNLLFDINLSEDESISEEAIAELSNGKGDDD